MDAITLVFDAQTEQLISQRYPKPCKPLIDLVQPPYTVNAYCDVLATVGLTECQVTPLDGGKHLRMVFPLAAFVQFWNMAGDHAETDH